MGLHLEYRDKPDDELIELAFGSPEAIADTAKWELQRRYAKTQADAAKAQSESASAQAQSARVIRNLTWWIAVATVVNVVLVLMNLLSG